MIKTAFCFLIPLVIASATITTVRFASADAGVTLIEPMAAGSAGPALAAEGSAAPAVTVNAAPGSTVTVEPAVTVNAAPGSTVTVEAPKLPDPVEDTSGAFDALWKLYKDGQLTALFILLGFFSLVYAERKVAWLRTGYRKVAVASLLYGGTMLAERAISGTTPTLSMIVGALGAAALMAFKSYGAKPTTPVA